MDSLISLIVGVGLLLGGIFLMRASLRHFLLHRIQRLLYKLTVTPWRGLLFGTVAAALMQSSSALTLVTIGLVSANYLSFYQSLGIILGANIGTCTTVQLMTLSFSGAYVLPCLAVTMLLMLRKKLRYPAMFLAGILSLFAGLDYLSGALGELAQYSAILQCLAAARDNPFYGIVGGILITVLFQSSTAATGVLMVLANEGFFSLETAAYIIYGNNIGSCLSSLLVGIASPLAGRRVAVAHLLLNVLGALIALPLTPLLIWTVKACSNDFSTQIACIHTIFNIASSIAVLPFTKQYANLIIWLIPEK
ncbi:Na/Pi cotransporter family protein [Propionispora hippei]|uniref:Phosphate:Na+ symporter n=1 Tax=Propionispora hippei DSM 15287 TaxID=1123003 RepID=A0A1M6LWL3_9FIRM|nr:Na/Pi symporter [Propionispora hippei]SHJ75555.1 phosphate:Na+ symporter [Propionispora hippei DSM 15287]